MICVISIATRYTRASQKPFFEVATCSSAITPVTTSSGRTEVEPLPVDPDFKKTNRLWLFLLVPQLAPEELAAPDCYGIAMLIPIMATMTGLDSGSRRLRRLNESIIQAQPARRH